MIAIENKLQEISEACASNGVKRLELFGSCARDQDVPGSDVDLLVEFDDPLRAGIFDRFLALHSALESIFGCPVDLIESSAIRNPILKRIIATEKKLVYAA